MPLLHIGHAVTTVDFVLMVTGLVVSLCGLVFGTFAVARAISGAGGLPQPSDERLKADLRALRRSRIERRVRSKS